MLAVVVDTEVLSYLFNLIGKQPILSFMALAELDRSALGILLAPCQVAGVSFFLSLIDCLY